MEDFEIGAFDWDLGNFEKSLKKHSVTMLEIEEVFFNHPLMVFSDLKHSQQEARFIAFGRTNLGRLLTIAFTIRERDRISLLRPISARPMHRKERSIYEEALAQTQE